MIKFKFNDEIDSIDIFYNDSQIGRIDACNDKIECATLCFIDIECFESILNKMKELDKLKRNKNKLNKKYLIGFVDF